MILTKPDYYYRQSAVLPYRRNEAGLEIILITSRKKKRWIIPKGVVDIGLTATASAQKEALEEAGVEGIIDPEYCAYYEYEKWGGLCKVEVFALLVTTVHACWEEDDYRQRNWFSCAQAIDITHKQELKTIIEEFCSANVGKSDSASALNLIQSANQSS